LNSGRLSLPDSSRLVAQLCSLERRVMRTTGRDLIDHPPGGMDGRSQRAEPPAVGSY
jgi:hypothetical protein